MILLDLFIYSNSYSLSAGLCLQLILCWNLKTWNKSNRSILSLMHFFPVDSDSCPSHSTVLVLVFITDMCVKLGTVSRQRHSRCQISLQLVGFVLQLNTPFKWSVQQKSSTSIVFVEPSWGTRTNQITHVRF